MSGRRLSAALALLAGLMAPTSLAATDTARKLSPKALYHALLKIPHGTTALPNSYESPTLGPATPSATAKRHHVIGEVAIGVTKKGTAGATILYIVFPTHADALADWNEGAHHLPKQRLTPPSFVPKPSAMFNAPVTVKDSAGKTTVLGTTVIVYLTGDLIVEVNTSSTSSKTHGDLAGAIGLARFAGTHLSSVATPPPPAALVA